MRCFLAVNLSEKCKREIDGLLQPVRELYPQLKWVKTKNLHLTLKFFGEIDDALRNLVEEKIELISSSFDLHFYNFLDAFPNRNNGRILWLGLEKSSISNLKNMYLQIENVLIQIGIEREKREFSPHLTVARAPKYGVIEKSLWNDKAKLETMPINSQVNSVELMKSRLGSGGAEYSVVKTFSFK